MNKLSLIKKVITAGFCSSIALIGASQVSVQGVVTAFETCPLNHVSIRSIKADKQAFTDSIGRFIIECQDNDILQFNASGFVERKLRVRDFKQVYINLPYGYREDSFDKAISGHHIKEVSLENALIRFPDRNARDYTRYQNIYELVDYEFNTLKVDGINIYNSKAISFSLSPQVLYVVNDMVVSDISFVRPGEVKKIEFIEDSEATAYGVRGANGVLRIALRND
jgi:hypothetical protein